MNAHSVNPTMQSAQPRIHLLTQYLWPDDAPTGIYAEHVADALLQRGHAPVLVAGPGSYRPGRRPPPVTPVHRLSAHIGRRGNLLSTALEYCSVHRAFCRYIAEQVHIGDIVVVTSAPPTTAFLHRHVRARGARSVYWLQDYYPELIRGLWDPPSWLQTRMHLIWDESLRAWDYVVKSAANLSYDGGNSRLIRNWNTVDPGPPRPARPRTALYSGNLGYGHDLEAFLHLCSKLRDEGYEVTVRGDGPGMRQLPGWIRGEPPLADPEALLNSYWEAEVHLVAADPGITSAVFPSKIWNALAMDRPVLTSGFAGPMAKELECSFRSNFRQNLQLWVEFLEEVLATSKERAG